MPIGSYKGVKMTPTQQWKAHAVHLATGENSSLMKQKLCDDETIEKLEKQNKILRIRNCELQQLQQL